jgi:hypothetical protein
VPWRVGSHCAPGYCWDAGWIKRRVVPPERGEPSRFSVSILDQADTPRRLAPHDDDADVRACASPYATVLGGRRWWVQRDRLAFPLHGVEAQSRPWGPGVLPASGREAWPRYGTQVIKDLRGPCPSSLAQAPLRGHGSQLPPVSGSPALRVLRGDPTPWRPSTPLVGWPTGLRQEPPGPPKFLTLLSTPTTFSGGPRQILGKLTNTLPL